LANAGELKSIPLRFIFNPDEEIGSPVSSPIITTEARRSVAAFVLECGSLNGGVVTGRKGRIGVHIEVWGRAGHAAFAGSEKESAIVEVAHKVIELEKLNGKSPGLTVNVGTIAGGIGSNTVPECARINVDVRFISREDIDFFEAELRKIINSKAIAGTRVEIKRYSYRQPMEQSEGNRALFKLVSGQASILGVNVVEEFRQGCSDANTVAQEGTPVIDGLGPLGDEDHSNREFILKQSLIERCKLLTFCIRECWRLYCQGQLFPADTR
jgi:glutamate carboxypeptidase